MQKSDPMVDGVNHYSTLITECWTQATDRIFQVAKLCLEASTSLSDSERRKLYRKLPFSISTFSKLTLIAKDKRLAPKKIQTLLPPSYSVIYTVARLDDGKFHGAIAAGVINPEATRAAIEAWSKTGKRMKRITSQSNSTLSYPSDCYAAVRLPKNATSEQMKKIEQLLSEIRKQCAAEVIYPTELPEAAALAKRIEEEEGKKTKRAEAILRKFARRRLKELKAKEKTWAFAEDETDIDSGFNLFTRVAEVFREVGIEHEFEELKNKIYDEVKSRRADKLIERFNSLPKRFIDPGETLAVIDSLNKKRTKKWVS